jgi:hypothetical protein
LYTYLIFLNLSCWPCCIEQSLRTQFSVSINVWCTETFWSPCTNLHTWSYFKLVQEIIWSVLKFWNLLSWLVYAPEVTCCALSQAIGA